MKLGGEVVDLRWSPSFIFHLKKKKRKRKKKEKSTPGYTSEKDYYYYLRYILDIDTWCMYPLATSRSGLVLEIICMHQGRQVVLVVQSLHTPPH